MKKTTLHLGLDVHKDSITIAVAEGGRDGEVRIHSTITNDLHAIEKALGRIRKAHPGAKIDACYSRVERDRLRAEPRPEGRQRRLPSTLGRAVS